MAAIVSIIGRRGVTIKARCRNQPNMSKIILYKPLLDFYIHLKQLYISKKKEHFNHKGRFDIYRRGVQYTYRDV